PVGLAAISNEAIATSTLSVLIYDLPVLLQLDRIGKSEIELCFGTVMDLLAFRSEDDTRACASTCGRADCCPLLAAGNSADDRADPGAACDDACITLLLGIRRSRIGI